MDRDRPLRRPMLRPGLRAVRRDADHLQVGLHGPERVVLPDEPGVRRMLAALTAATPPDLDEPAVERWYDELCARGLVVEADDLRGPVLRSLPTPAVRAAFAREGPAARSRLAARAAARVGLVVDDPWRLALARLLASTGLAVAGADEPAAVHLVLGGAGSSLDELVRADSPHLLVTAWCGRIVVGPFVVPGVTACARCVEAHHSERDPGHATIVEQLREDPDGLPPVDPLLMQLALAWAVHDVVRFVEGELPATWSSTVAVDSGPRLETSTWPRHPACGCSWGDRLAAG